MNRLIQVMSVGLVCCVLVGCGGSSSSPAPTVGKDKMGKMSDDKMDKMKDKMDDKMGEKMRDKMDGEKMKDKMDDKK